MDKIKHLIKKNIVHIILAGLGVMMVQLFIIALAVTQFLVMGGLSDVLMIPVGLETLGIVLLLQVISDFYASNRYN